LTIKSRSNPRVKQLRAAFAGQARLAGGLVAIEGEHLVQEALRSGLTLAAVFVDERFTVPDWLTQNIEPVILSGEAFASAVDTRSPQGIAALLEPPAWSLEPVLDLAHLANGSPLLLIAAGLQDPGNLGSLVRSAEAFGAHAVLSTTGTVSCWNQKAIRASAGSVFRLPVITVTLDEVAMLKLRGIRLYAAAAESATSLENVDLDQPSAVMIGNEGAGLDPELFAIADERIAIPMPGPVESLNAAIAGSLLLYQASQRRAASYRSGRT
jgi:TrmH family RNA methyltransferase